MPKIHLVGSLFALLAVVCAGQVTITEYPIPGQPVALWIAAGPDGNLWFTEPGVGALGRITPTGVVTAFPTVGPQPTAIIAGPDGNLWFTEESGSAIGKMTTAGAVLATYTTSYFSNGIAAGPDGNLWFTEFYTNLVSRITPSGVITQFGPTSSSYPAGITVGPDGNLWFAEEGYRPDLGTGVGASIGRITTAGVITEFPLTPGTVPYQIAAGPDGNLWLTEASGNNIGRITPTGVITEFPIPTLGSYPIGISAGPDGNVWFTEAAGNKIGRITPTGAITEFATPTISSAPDGITTGPDGNVWFTENAGNIGKINIGPRYSVCLLYDPTKAVKSGSTIPIKLELCDGSGHDLSSASITVQAIGITQISTLAPGTLEDSGNSNPDNNFRFDATLGNTGGYIFNLKTTGLSKGTYRVNFTVTGDSSVYAANFQVK